MIKYISFDYYNEDGQIIKNNDDWFVSFSHVFNSKTYLFINRHNSSFQYLSLLVICMVPHDSILVAFNKMMFNVSTNCAYTSPLMAININFK